MEVPTESLFRFDSVQAAQGSPPPVILCQQTFDVAMSAIDSERWFAILNPASGGGRALRGRTRIEARLRESGLDWTLAVSEYPGHTVELAAEAARKGFTRFIAVGGDGTLSEIVTGLFGDPVPVAGIAGKPPTLALIPVGRGNDWARTHRIPADFADAIRLIGAGHTVTHDIGVAELARGGQPVRRCFVNVAGVGFDAYVVEQTRATRLGPFTYLAGLLRGFLGYRVPRLRIRAADQEIEAPMFVAFAALGRYCGGGMHIAPLARTDDGLLDVTLIGEMSKLELLANLRRLFDGSILQYRRVRSLRVPRVEVGAAHAVGVQADGELIGETPVAFSVLPGALRVVVPAARR
jgi:YegS/Rv2252/BmrU family lipid kinase